jgi:hypothetical protein
VLPFQNDIYFLPIGSRVSLSLRWVTIYNNSYLSLGDIGGFIGDEALQCHTDNVNCCGSGLADNESVLAEWYYPNGSKVSSVDDIDNGNNESYFSDSDGFFSRRTQSLIGLFSGRSSTESGRYCCKIQDQCGIYQIMCVNLGKNSHQSCLLLDRSSRSIFVP